MKKILNNYEYEENVIINNYEDYDVYINEMEDIISILEKLTDIDSDYYEQIINVYSTFVMLTYSRIKDSGIELTEMEVLNEMLDEVDSDTYNIMRNVLITFFKGTYEVMCGVENSSLEDIGKKGVDSTLKNVIKLIKGN
jgi:hypothetical protein